MRLFVPFLLAAFLAVYISPRPEFTKSDGRLLTMQPHLLRAMSGFAHTLVGDFVWLKSRYVDEIRYGENVDMEVFSSVIRAHVILDPHFTIPVQYAATYLASIPKNPLLGVELLRLSQSLNPERFDLLIIEALIRVNYDVPESVDRLEELVQRMETMPENKKLVGRIVIDDELMKDLVAYVRAKESSEDMIEADLVDLLKQTENPERRALIEAELERVRAQKSGN
jgi:hypothetical protein